MIIGTAGHIDHGKTSLVRALTGVDTDRLKDEKDRGISIELGYAYIPSGHGDVMGFIDVPGHERLVHTMAAGASGIDFGLLVVAADDGVMPQTREHLAILALLGVKKGAIAITKIDRVDAERLNAVTHEVCQLVEHTFLAGAPVFPVSVLDRDLRGVDVLATYLKTQSQTIESRDRQKLFRLAIDRAFSLPGQGTVVTGTVHAGRISVDDDLTSLRLMPSNTLVRVRSIHAQNQASEAGWAGQRCALNLAGVSTDEVSRGDWVADARCFTPSKNIDVELVLLSSAEHPVRTWSPLHIHIGAAHYLAHVVPLSADTILPGQSAKVQLVFDQPVCAMSGDRYIARNAQARQTIGGGRVLDPDAPDRKRRTAARLAWLDAIAQMLEGRGIGAMLAQAPYGLDEALLMHYTGADINTITIPPDAIWIAQGGGARTVISSESWSALAGRVEQALERFHGAAPDEPGVDSSRLRRIALPTLPQTLWPPLLETLIEQAFVRRNGPWLHCPGHSVTLSPAEEAIAAQLLVLIELGGFDPPWTRDLAEQVGQPEEDVRRILRKLVRQGRLFQVVRDLFYDREQVAQLARLFVSAAGEQGVKAAEFRDATKLGRKRAIQILEYFGRIGYTRRIQDRHILRQGSTIFAELHTIDS